MDCRGLIAIDVDGTLLTPNGEMSSFTKETLLSLREKGYQIVLATGRPFRAGAKFYLQLGGMGPIICYNGLLCLDPSESSFPRVDARFPRAKVLAIAEKATMVKAIVSESETSFFMTSWIPGLERYFPLSSMERREGDLEDILTSDPYTCIFQLTGKDDSSLEEAAKQEGLLYHRWTSLPLSELAMPGYTKGTGLSHVASYFGIEKERIYGFGDSENDRSLLSVCGHPFVMANSRSSKLKKDFPVTEKGNADDGVAYQLLQLGL